ncbi:hypothetical protein CHS0354_018566 [Potamilus streckersoni]|uniref:Solute-binding protein family 5 domain-containing protein n=1 Tax=Potamilus streckersoni TaxID=2493646 RepID=A0AAE0TBU6_9BIVA|nr:hypothetical protein CHS0354_018566 [Potamilus streckersoni]
MIKRIGRLLTVSVLFGLLSTTPGVAEEFKMGMVLEPPHLDPTAGAAAAIDEVVYANIFEGLTRIGADGQVLPALASDWTVSKDSRVYTFNLKRGVKFHDGTAFSAQDVKFSFERAAADTSENAQKPVFKNIAKAEAVNPYKVRITLKEARGNFLILAGYGDAVMVSEKSAKQNKSSPIGTGPFVFKEWRKGDRVMLEKNKVYHGPRPKLDRITFRFISDPNAARNALLTGDVDGFANFPAPELISGLKTDTRFEVAIGNTEGETILAINNKRTPFNDLKVRQALAYAIDRQEIVDGAMFGIGQVIGSHFSPSAPGYVDLTGRYPYDPAKAKALLKEAGIKEGLTVSLKLPPPVYARRGAAVGIKAEISAVEWAQWLDQVFRNKDYDLTIVSHTEPMDIDIYARPDYYFNYQNPALVNVIDTLNRTWDTKKRNVLLADAQKIITEDAVNVYLFMLPKIGIWRKEFKGLWHNSPVQANDMTAVYPKTDCPVTIILPKDYHARQELENNRVICISEETAQSMDIRALRIGILNIMPEAEAYEYSLLHPLGRSVLQIVPVWIKLRSHTYNSSNAGHLVRLYQYYDEAIRNGSLDGMIITGAPVEKLDYEQVRYWSEIREILNDCRHSVPLTLGICWGGLALAYLMGFEKQNFARKLFGVFETHNLNPRHAVTGALDDVFWLPHSRYSGIADRDLEQGEKDGRVRLLAHAPDTGYSILNRQTADGSSTSGILNTKRTDW